MTIQEKINEIYKAVQELQLQPTEYNVSRLYSIMQGLKEVYAGSGMLQERVKALTVELNKLKPDEEGTEMEESETEETEDEYGEEE